MKREHHDIWEKLDALKQQPLITEEALQSNQNQTMDRIASLPPDKIIKPTFTIKQKITALSAAACLAGLIWLLLQPASNRQPVAENQPKVFSSMQQDTIRSQQTTETAERENLVVTAEGKSPLLQKKSNTLETLWTSLTTEEMEMYLIDNDEF